MIDEPKSRDSGEKLRFRVSSMRRGTWGRIAASAKRNLLRRTTRAARDSSSRVRVLGSERRGGADDLKGFLELGLEESFSRIEESIFALEVEVEVAMEWREDGVREEPLPPIVTNSIDGRRKLLLQFRQRGDDGMRIAFAASFSLSVSFLRAAIRRMSSKTLELTRATRRVRLW